jgi:predicted TIM-barrel fold metal-dependent hydrolase
MKDFPKLKICVAHLGGDSDVHDYMRNPNDRDNWFVDIKRMAKEYPNFYTDISFTLYEKGFYPLLKVLLEKPYMKQKILFGSDYYMVQTETNERTFSMDLRSFLGEDKFKQIAVVNPKKYLGLN